MYDDRRIFTEEPKNEQLYRVTVKIQISQVSAATYIWGKVTYFIPTKVYSSLQNARWKIVDVGLRLLKCVFFDSRRSIASDEVASQKPAVR